MSGDAYLIHTNVLIDYLPDDIPSLDVHNPQDTTTGD